VAGLDLARRTGRTGADHHPGQVQLHDLQFGREPGRSDAQGVEITGKGVEKALDKAGLHCNKNMIPFDPKPALVTSGIRLGTPAATTRGMGAAEFVQIGQWVAAIARDPQNLALQEQTKQDVKTLVQDFPVPA